MADFRKVARRKARKYGIDPHVFERQINQESGYNPDVIYGRRSSPAGAQGIAQIMPATARSWGVNPLRPRRALDAAAKHMAEYVKSYGSYAKALAAYNAGPGAVQSGAWKNYSETRNYVNSILNGQSPEPPGKHASGGAQTTMGVKKVTRTTPGVDRSGERRSLLLAYLADRGKPDALLTLGAGLQAAQDTPASTTTRLVPVKTTLKPGKTLVIGDSLGVGTVPYLKRMVGGRVVSNVKTGRPSHNGVTILQRNPGDYTRIVFDLGTNDPSAKDLATSIRQAKRLAPGADIYIPTVNGPDAARKNSVIRRLAGGNVHVVDWQAQLGGDGIHATPEGYRQRARQLARAMGEQPATRQPGATSLKGLDTFDGRKVAAWIAPILREARREGVKFSLSSGWRSDVEQKRIYDSGVRPAAKPRAYGGGGSNHEFKAYPGGAVDVNNRDGGAQRLAQWLAASRYRNVLVYAGAKDPVHFSKPHNGSY